MKQVILYGHLAKKFGRHHRFDVRNPAEAVRALKANFPDFEQHVLKNGEPGYHVRVGSDYRDEEGLAYPADGVIKIIPAVGGAGNAFKIILGAALIYFTMGTGSLLGSWAIGTGSSLAVTAVGMAGNIGMALVLGGISQILFKPPASQSTDAPQNQPSYSFDGPVNTVSQGNPIPVCYGRLIVGSQVISASIDTGDIAI